MSFKYIFQTDSIWKIVCFKMTLKLFSREMIFFIITCQTDPDICSPSIIRLVYQYQKSFYRLNLWGLTKLVYLKFKSELSLNYGSIFPIFRLNIQLLVICSKYKLF